MQFAMLFPGQGSHEVGMGKDLYERFPVARQVFEEADDLLGFSLSTICFAGPEETLTETHHAQPALLTHSVAALRVLETHGVRASSVAGHSLGEYTALVAAGAMSFEDALRTVRQRGVLMFECGQKQAGSMAVVIGLDRDQVDEHCVAARKIGVCDLANLNALDQIVISGNEEAVTQAMLDLAKAKAKVFGLKVSGAFHSSLMREPGIALGEVLDAVKVDDARVPVIANVTAAPEQKGPALRELLKKQISSSVRWYESMLCLRQIDQNAVLEIGAGRVLRGLLRKADRKATCTSIGTAEGLEGLLQKVETVG